MLDNMERRTSNYTNVLPASAIAVHSLATVLSNKDNIKTKSKLTKLQSETMNEP